MAPAWSLLGRARHVAVAALVGAQVASAGDTTVCRPTECFDGSCDGLPVTFASRTLTLSAWTGDNYSLVGNMPAYAAVEDDFGIFLHGPLFRPAQRKAGDDLPALLVTGSLTDKVFKFTDFRHAGNVITASMKFVAWSPGPSTIWPVPPDHEGGPERLLIAEGNPFVVNPGDNHTTQMWKGGVDLIDQEKCTKIFPTNPLMALIGRVVNTVECHPSGFCFFSVWKFYDDTMPMMMDDCLYYCKARDANDPSSCEEVGVVEDEAGNRICHQKNLGAVHGFKIGKDDPKDSNIFDMFLMYTGKGTFDTGDSEIYRLQLQVSFEGKLGKTPYVKTLSKAPWGTDLWQKTVQQPHDVGVDHAWVDDDGKYVWVGTFRTQNDGVHMLEYDTGKLIHSIHGIADVIPGKYGYTSGISGVGAYGKPGSYLAIATCEEFGQQIFGGHSAMVLLDISKPAVNSTAAASTLMI